MQRIWKTLIVTCSLFLLTGGAVGFAVAASDSEPTEAYDTPRPGDTAVYTARQFIIGPNSGGDMGTIRVVYEWLPEEWRMDGNFELRLVHPIKMTGYFPNYDPVERWGFVDAATGEGVASGAQGVGYVQRPTQGPAGMLAEEGAAYNQIWYKGQSGACAMHTALHGAAKAPATIDVGGYCDYVNGATTLTYERQGTVDRDGKQVVHYQHPERTYFEAYYTRDQPFPVEFTASLSNMIYGPWLEGRMYRLHLQSVERGTEEYTRLGESLVAPSPGPAIPIERPDFAADSGTMDALLSFDDAWTAILTDENEPRMSRFLDTHPDAYMAYMAYTESVNDQGLRSGFWTIGASTGASTLLKQVRYEPGTDILGVDLLGYQTTVVNRESSYTHPSPDIAHTKMVSIADQVERFRFFFGEGTLVNSISYWVTCTDPCDAAKTTMWVGTADRSTEGPAGFADGARYGFQLIGTTLDGTPWTAYGYQQVMDMGVPFVSQGDAGPVVVEYQQGGAVWSPPSAAIAGGFGLLSLIGGALYQYWPQIRAMMFMQGFSRIQKSDLLNHPTRARILDVVEQRPGIHFQGLVREVGLAKGTLRHHLSKLEADDLIRSKAHDNRICYVVAGLGRAEAQEVAVLGSDGTRRVYEVLRKRPTMATQDVAAKLGMAPSTVSYHRKKLRQAGLAA